MLKVNRKNGGVAPVDESYLTGPESVPVPRLARNVRVGATTYAVKRSGEPDGEHRHAETTFVHREIRFSILCDEVDVPNTLLHEIIHAVSQDRSLDMSESATETLANGLTAVLQDLGWMPTRLKLADDA